MIRKKFKPTSTKKFNLCLGFLRVILSFLVVMTHCFNIKTTKSKLLIKIFINKLHFIHVPTFFIMSFYFMKDLFIKRNKLNMVKRFKRLLIPYIS